MKWFEDPVQNEAYAQEMRLALAITFIGNLLLASIKWLASIRFGSSALQADAWNSISDVLYSLTLIVGFFGGAFVFFAVSIALFSDEPRTVLSALKRRKAGGDK